MLTETTLQPEAPPPINPNFGKQWMPADKSRLNLWFYDGDPSYGRIYTIADRDPIPEEPMRIKNQKLLIFTDNNDHIKSIKPHGTVPALLGQPGLIDIFEKMPGLLEVYNAKLEQARFADYQLGAQRKNELRSGAFTGSFTNAAKHSAEFNAATEKFFAFDKELAMHDLLSKYDENRLSERFGGRERMADVVKQMSTLEQNMAQLLYYTKREGVKEEDGKREQETPNDPATDRAWKAVNEITYGVAIVGRFAYTARFTEMRNALNAVPDLPTDKKQEMLAEIDAAQVRVQHLDNAKYEERLRPAAARLYALLPELQAVALPDEKPGTKTFKDYANEAAQTLARTGELTETTDLLALARMDFDKRLRAPDEKIRDLQARLEEIHTTMTAVNDDPNEPKPQVKQLPPTPQKEQGIGGPP